MLEKFLDFIHDPEHRVKFALFLFFGSILAWPITALTIFRAEQQGILGLSWFAVIVTAVDILATTDVRKAVEDD